MNEKKKNPPGIGSTLMMVFGSLMLGIIAARAIEEYQKDNFVLDQVEVQSPKPTGVFTTFLDLSGPDISTGSAEQTLGEVQSHVEERYGGDDVEKYFSRMPKHIQIPAIELEADIGFATLRDVEVNGKKFQQWVAPDFVVGWHFTSAPLGEPGNTVLNGHHNINGEVFKNLHLVQIGDEIILSSDVGVYHYQVASVMILPEKYESEEVRLQNAKWIQPSEDERITLITCWPYESNTHRVIVVALPSEEIQSVKN